MRAPFSTYLPRLAVVASLVASCAGLVSAYDEDNVADNLQPYIGGWLGMYQVETTDLRYLVARSSGSGKTPNLDLFSSVVPAGGVSLGVAYGRLHIGANLGYQLRDGGDISKAKQDSFNLHPSYQYEVIPLDVNLDLAMLPNEYPINFLIGGSLGIGFTRIQNPFKGLVSQNALDTTSTLTPKDNIWETNNFLQATGYVGARINLAQRLNLEGQLGYRILRTDAIQSDNGPNPAQPSEFTYNPDLTVKSYKLKSIPIDLSGAYLRVDLRWTFASKADKERAAALDHRRKVLERLDNKFAFSSAY